MKKAFILTITFFAASFAFASVQEDKTLFETTCGTCHSLERSLQATKNLMAWKRTIKRMDRYANGRIPETEANKIAEYLASIGKPEKPVPHEISKEEIKGLDERELSEFKKVRVNQFIEPSVCGGCHSEKFKQWNGSMHSKAFYDPLWRKQQSCFSKKRYQMMRSLR